jgi:hypothetical protein
VPFVDYLKLSSPYISTNNRHFYLCPVDCTIGFNFAWAEDPANSGAIPISDLMFPCSYYYFFSFYQTDNYGGSPAGGPSTVRKTTEVRYPSRKVNVICNAGYWPPPANAQGFGQPHLPNGWLLLFPDGHAQAVLDSQFYTNEAYGYSGNLDWTLNGLSGLDVH